MVIWGDATGRGKVNISVRKFRVCRSGTLAIRSEFLAMAIAAAKLPTIATTFRRRPSVCSALSIEPFSLPLLEK